MTTNTWFRDAAERQEHIDIIKDNKKWPYEDRLFLKHPRRLDRRTSLDADKPCLGFITRPGECAVHDDDGNVERFTSVEAMVDAGWVVD